MGLSNEELDTKIDKLASIACVLFEMWKENDLEKQRIRNLFEKDGFKVKQFLKESDGGEL